MTTATYDEATNEFVINTPNELALKWWIGASAELANKTVLWAQLIVGGVNRGVHAFIINIRDLVSSIHTHKRSITDSRWNIGYIKGIHLSI